MKVITPDNMTAWSGSRKETHIPPEKLVNYAHGGHDENKR